MPNLAQCNSGVADLACSTAEGVEGYVASGIEGFAPRKASFVFFKGDSAPVKYCEVRLIESNW